MENNRADDEKEELEGEKGVEKEVMVQGEEKGEEGEGSVRKIQANYSKKQIVKSYSR